MTSMLKTLIEICHGGLLTLFCYNIFLFLNRSESNVTPPNVRYSAAMLMAVLSVEMILHFLTHDIPTDLSGTFDYISVPFSAILLLELTGQRPMAVKSALAHILPFTAAILTAFAFYFTGHEEWMHITVKIIHAGIIIYLGIYVHILHSRIEEHEKEVKEFYSNPEEYSIRWIWRWILILLSGTLMFTILYILIATEWAMLIYSITAIFIWGNLCDNILHMKSATQMKLAMAEAREAEMAAEEAPFMDEMDMACRGMELYRNENLTREDVAKVLKTNHTTLARRLKKATGLTFSEYIGRIRLDEASRMLLESDERVDQIIYYCGYRNKSTFYRAFSNRYGCNPKIYRARKGR